ncbi:metallophosphoesterase [Rubripirellula obstinata]|uniref:metallophosphoesterase n=1 Tax=Rubripirellula obstinata TaxID=406547 RepID=UPI00135CB08A|nr:metallophosphoesterase [Rubripirellula obstinata]
MQIRQASLPIVGLPPNLHGKTMVQVSDFHIGATSEEHLLATIDSINQLKPDLLVMTGDFIDHSFQGATSTIQRIFANLNPASITTLGCLGNHDYGSRWSDTVIADQVTGALSELGIQVLRDEHVNVDGLDVFGLDDFWSPRYQFRRVLREASASRGSLCLCHNPDVCDQTIWGDFQGVILSGHTHGGQCKPPFLPPPRLPVRNRNYVSGFYDLDRKRTLYINRGIGYGLKVRFNSRPEITCFELQRSSDESSV